jgi:hypothetical protein
MFNLEGTATILSMAADGFQFAGTTSGMTRSDWNEWQNKATTHVDTLKNWIPPQAHRPIPQRFPNLTNLLRVALRNLLLVSQRPLGGSKGGSNVLRVLGIKGFEVG